MEYFNGLFRMGYYANGPDLNIKHELDKPIRFYTDAANGIGTFNNQRMIIDKSPGHVGIGLNFNPGNDVLDIQPDINFPNTGYGINNQTVLHNWGVGNIFCGVGAGMSNVGGFDNTFMGVNAGGANATGSGNTFIGCETGSGKKQVNNAIAIGYKAKVTCNDCTVIGGKYVGICTTEPTAALDVNGTVQAKQILITANGATNDLLAMITDLQNEITRLKQQLSATIKN